MLFALHGDKTRALPFLLHAAKMDGPRKVGRFYATRPQNLDCWVALLSKEKSQPQSANFDHVAIVQPHRSLYRLGID